MNSSDIKLKIKGQGIFIFKNTDNTKKCSFAFLNKDNECVYTILQKAPTNFTGGEIGTQIFFKFGTTEIQKKILATIPPWEVTQLITLNS